MLALAGWLSVAIGGLQMGMLLGFWDLTFGLIGDCLWLVVDWFCILCVCACFVPFVCLSLFWLCWVCRRLCSAVQFLLIVAIWWFLLVFVWFGVLRAWLLWLFSGFVIWLLFRCCSCYVWVVCVGVLLNCLACSFIALLMRLNVGLVNGCFSCYLVVTLDLWLFAYFDLGVEVLCGVLCTCLYGLIFGGFWFARVWLFIVAISCWFCWLQFLRVLVVL